MSAFTPFTCRRVHSHKRWAVATAIAMTMTTASGPALVPAVHAQGGPGAVGFVLDANDLRFIYRQIQIAENHASGEPLFGPGANQVPEVRVPFGLRTVNGQYNNLVVGQEKFGSSDQVFPRMTRPQFQAAAAGTTYNSKTGQVTDPQPRIISNLISDQTASNPAAVAAAGEFPVIDGENTLFIPNVAPDEGLSAPFNSMFTFFGQFFDHGLDLVNKGGSGTVFVPLQQDDPLFAPNAPNFMMLTRATNLPGPDNVVGTADDILEDTNQTTPFVDQNQTYTSHPSHQVFLREYELDAAGKPVSTGRMIDGAGTLKNIGNWAEVKAQAAAMLGIGLVDSDVFNVPLLATDPYGRFLRGPNGYPMMMLQGNGVVEGNPAAPVSTANAMRTGHAFLDDIAHNAVPGPGMVPDGDSVANRIDVPRPDENGQRVYDDELLDAHFITGDGRGNENIALTAVHTVFHAEHNRLRDHIDGLINTPGFLTAAEAAAWKAQAAQPTDTPKGSGWGYGERLFQAARFVTEMQYQHLVFEEFARTLSPAINAFIGDGINFRSDMNPAIPAEFAHATYRLGHSMLTETIARTRPDGTPYDISLLAGFLNPLEFNHDGNGGTLTAAQAAGAIFQGGTRQSGNAIDEFITEAVRNNLLGLPLDLGVLNIARGRSEGIAPLNSVRRDLYEASGDPQLLPYESWADFGFSMKHGESLVNFIAAYGVDPNNGPLNSATTMADKRAAAAVLMLDPAFMFAPGTETGVERIDLWIGGLAEQISPFGGMLGSTFNYIFELTLEGLQNADRFYYLERLDGLNLLAQMEGNSFSELVSRNTTLTGPSASVFSRADFVFNLESLLRVAGIISDDPSTPEDESAMTDLQLQPNGAVRYSGGAHVVFNGRASADWIISSIGDDTLRGDDGNDRIEGGAGNDQPIGGAGDDIITDTFGDDVIKGGPGNDAIHGGSGPFDLLQGNEGHDFIVGGIDASEVFGGSGNDVIYVGKDLTESFGGAGDDWLEGAETPASVLVGDENNQFQNDPSGGHDVFWAGPGDADFDMEGGDDVMVANVLPTHRLEGMLGFDWASYQGDVRPVDADMKITGAIAVNAPLNELRDRYDLTEGLSGTNFNDLLRGDDRAEADLRDDGLTGVANGHVLTAAGIARVSGVSAVLPAGATEFAGGNIILGGAGSDTIAGRGGDDIIDGDRWLRVQLQGTLNDGTVKRANSLHELRPDVFANPQRLNPGNIRIMREVVNTGALASDVDVAEFQGAFAEYTIAVNANGSITVSHTAPVGNINDGTDTLWNIEQLKFTDQTISAAGGIGNLIPNVAGLSQADAITAIGAAGFTLGTVSNVNSNTVAFGTALSTTPLAGVRMPAGSIVNLTVSLGPLVPDVHDHTVVNGVPAGFPAAQDELALSGLVLGTITQVNDPEVEAGLIVTQNPLPGGVIAPGGAVNVFVSSGPAAPNTVPVVAGLQQGDADGAIEAAGLTVGAVTFALSNTVPAGAVISTNPAAGTVLAPGAAVAMVVSLGSDGLVLALGFDEGAGRAAVDSSVVGNTATTREASMVRAAGKFGTAMRFDGVNDWVTVTDGAAASPLDLTNRMTIEAWVNPTALSGWETVVLKERAGGLAYALYAHDGAPLAQGVAAPAGYNRINNTDVAVRGTTAIPLNAWTHLAFTYDGANERLYVNGVLVRTRAQTGNNLQTNNVVRIGGNNQFANEFFGGLIDEVRIYRTVRSQAQIQSDMNTPITPVP